MASFRTRYSLLLPLSQCQKWLCFLAGWFRRAGWGRTTEMNGSQLNVLIRTEIWTVNVCLKARTWEDEVCVYSLLLLPKHHCFSFCCPIKLKAPHLKREHQRSFVEGLEGPFEGSSLAWGVIELWKCYFDKILSGIITCLCPSSTFCHVRTQDGHKNILFQLFSFHPMHGGTFLTPCRGKEPSCFKLPSKSQLCVLDVSEAVLTALLCLFAQLQPSSL